MKMSAHEKKAEELADQCHNLGSMANSMGRMKDPTARRETLRAMTQLGKVLQRSMRELAKGGTSRR